MALTMTASNSNHKKLNRKDLHYTHTHTRMCAHKHANTCTAHQSTEISVGEGGGGFASISKFNTWIFKANLNAKMWFTVHSTHYFLSAEDTGKKMKLNTPGRQISKKDITPGSRQSKLSYILTYSRCKNGENLDRTRFSAEKWTSVFKLKPFPPPTSVCCHVVDRSVHYTFLLHPPPTPPPTIQCTEHWS